eukprot:7944_1
MPRSIAYSEYVLVVGGRRANNVFAAELHIIDTTTDSVSVSDSTMHYGASNFGVILVDNVIYKFGGINTLTPSPITDGWLDQWETCQLTSSIPSNDPSIAPSNNPTDDPTDDPTNAPTVNPTDDPSIAPSNNPTNDPTNNPTNNPTDNPTNNPTNNPTDDPTNNPSIEPTDNPTQEPTLNPVKALSTSHITRHPSTREPSEPPRRMFRERGVDGFSTTQMRTTFKTLRAKK